MTYSRFSGMAPRLAEMGLDYELVFINDGGCKPGIKKFIVESSSQPIFWQFVGIGDSNFDVLRNLNQYRPLRSAQRLL